MGGTGYGPAAYLAVRVVVKGARKPPPHPRKRPKEVREMYVCKTCVNLGRAANPVTHPDSQCELCCPTTPSDPLEGFGPTQKPTPTRKVAQPKGSLKQEVLAKLRTLVPGKYSSADIVLLLGRKCGQKEGQPVVDALHELRQDGLVGGKQQGTHLRAPWAWEVVAQTEVAAA